MKADMLVIAKTFNYDEKICRLAKEVVERIDDHPKEMSDALVEAVDATIIWNEDKWAIIAYYSTPNFPINYNDACSNFLEDLTNCI